jgi:hypothetical protein
MRSHDYFGVALRVFGIWFLYKAGYDIVFLGVKLAGLVPNSLTSTSEYKWFIAYYLAAALIAFVYTDHIVKLIYGPTIAAKAVDDATK